jgi:hypothetical protein
LNSHKHPEKALIKIISGKKMMTSCLVSFDPSEAYNTSNLSLPKTLYPPGTRVLYLSNLVPSLDFVAQYPLLILLSL